MKDTDILKKFNNGISINGIVQEFVEIEKIDRYLNRDRKSMSRFEFRKEVERVILDNLGRF